jgi:beta-galactosidase
MLKESLPMKRVTFLSGLFWLGIACGLAQDMAELEVDHNVNAVFVTPHTDWATPYALGPTRALFFVNGRGANAREVIELKQRFDLDPQMVFWARIVDTTRDDWHGGENGVLRLAQLLAQRWDAFVFMDVQPEKLPLEQQVALIQAVSAGAGLVLLGSDDPRVLKDKNRLKELPAFLGDVEGAVAFAVKNGRGLRLPPRPDLGYRPGWEVAYDEWDMRLGKAILWAAGKEPKLSLTLTAKGTELPRTGLPGAAATLQWQGAGAKTVADVVLRREDGTVISTRQQPLGAPGGSVALESPLVRAGRYVFDVIARDGETVAAFASVPFAVVGERQVAEITLTPDWAEIGQRLSGQVTLAGPPGGAERLLISLFDRRDRELVRQVVEPVTTAAAFSFEVPSWFPMLLEVRATLLEGQQEVASAWRFARVVKRHRGQFNFVMWDTPSGNLAPYAEESLARNGVTAQLRGGTPQPYIAAYDIAWIPYTTHIAADKDAQGVMKPVCWNDEAAIQAQVDKIVDSYLPSRQHGVFVYSLGDEIAVRGSCLSPSCLEAYRAYLREQYGDLAALNASWGSAYASFAEVQLSTPTDNDEAQAFREGNFPRWFDRQAFQSYSFCRLCERFGKGFRRIDPESRCGFEGAGTFGQADDLDGFVRSNGFWSPYPGTADEVLRSIAPRDFPRANWMGYTKDADSLLEKYWRMVTRGCDSVWWWRWEVMGRFHGWLAPNLDPYPAVQEILRDTQMVRDGLGDLLLHSEMQTDGIGILYSQPSAYAAKVQVSPSYGSYESNHEAFHNALREMGLNFRYFTDRQLRLGEVELSRFGVIILPMTQALSAAEAESVRQYVRQGGVLIADLRPGIYDGHLKPLAAGQLDDVFGVLRSGCGEALTEDGLIKIAAAGAAPESSLVLPKVKADGGVQAAGATAAGAAGQAPLFLSNRFGQGRAVLLNLALGSYSTLGSEASPDLVARWLRLTLESGRVSPALDLRSAQGQPVRNLEVTRWLNGPVQIVSLFRPAGTAETVTLRLPQELHAYDLQKHEDLGKKTEFSLAVSPYRARFYALSPEPLQPVQLEAAPTVARGGVQRLLIRSALPLGQQAVKLRLELPDGRLADWLAPVAIVDQKGTAVEVPVALNDPPGLWTLQATDLYTGKTTSTSFSVK